MYYVLLVCKWRWIYDVSSVPRAWEPEGKVIAMGGLWRFFDDSVDGGLYAKTKPLLSLVFVWLDVNVSEIPEKMLLSLLRDGDFCIGLRGVVGGDVLNSSRGGNDIGPGWPQDLFLWPRYIAPDQNCSVRLISCEIVYCPQRLFRDSSSRIHGVAVTFSTDEEDVERFSGDCDHGKREEMSLPWGFQD